MCNVAVLRPRSVAVHHRAHGLDVWSPPNQSQRIIHVDGERTIHQPNLACDPYFSPYCKTHRGRDARHIVRHADGQPPHPGFSPASNPPIVWSHRSTDTSSRGPTSSEKRFLLSRASSAPPFASPEATHPTVRAAASDGRLEPTPTRRPQLARRCAVKRPVHALSPSPRRHRRNALLRGRKPSSSSSPSPPRPTTTPKRSRVEVEASCRSGLCRSPWDAVPAPEVR
ncbi:hypothetical protein DAI22_05g195600 [Oryza sativa Japonica Group]|nr:hypothetical protein DAI22_05g195600 [Oryza sativa Japonica Group]